MNNADQLRELKTLYGLTSQKVADILLVSKKAVDSWLVSSDSPNYRPMDDSRLDHLKCKLKTRKKVIK